MHSQRPQPDRPTATSEPMRAEDVQRMLAARQEQPQPRRHSLRRRLGTTSRVRAALRLRSLTV